MKINKTALILDSKSDISHQLKVLKQSNITHWLHLQSGNQARLHFRKNGPPDLVLLSEKIGSEYGVNLASELKFAGCKNIVVYLKKLDSNYLNKIISQKSLSLIFVQGPDFKIPQWKLTRFQIEILQSLSLGLDLAQISKKSTTSISGIKRELQSIRTITGIHDRAEIVATCLRAGVIG